MKRLIGSGDQLDDLFGGEFLAQFLHQIRKNEPTMSSSVGNHQSDCFDHESQLSCHEWHRKCLHKDDKEMQTGVDFIALIADDKLENLLHDELQSVDREVLGELLNNKFQCSDCVAYELIVTHQTRHHRVNKVVELLFILIHFANGPQQVVSDPIFRHGFIVETSERLGDRNLNKFALHVNRRRFLLENLIEATQAHDLRAFDHFVSCARENLLNILKLERHEIDTTIVVT